MAQSATNNTQMAPAPQPTQMQQQPQKLSFSQIVSSKRYQQLLMNSLTDPKKVEKFTASIISAVNNTPTIQDCTPGSILATALTGESLGLSPSPQVGQYYFIPFKQKEKRDRQGNLIQAACTKAQFVISYKGMLQLAIRSGVYHDIDAKVIKDGEYLGRDRQTGNPVFAFLEDDDKWEELPVIGYMSTLEYLNGFKKTIYWSKKKMIKHANEFSSAFSASAYDKLLKGEIPQDQMWKYSSFWYKDFDTMAQKTMLRQIISKWGIMSTEFQMALDNDGRVMEDVRDDGKIITMEEPKLDFAQPQIVDVEEQVDLESL